MAHLTSCAFHAAISPAAIWPVINPMLLNHLSGWQVRRLEGLDRLNVLGVEFLLFNLLTDMDFASSFRRPLTAPLSGPATIGAETTSLTKRSWVNGTYRWTKGRFPLVYPCRPKSGFFNLNLARYRPPFCLSKVQTVAPSDLAMTLALVSLKSTSISLSQILPTDISGLVTLAT